MKFVNFGILAVIIVTNYTTANKCSKDALQVLENCYARLFLDHLDFSYPYLAPNFIQELKEAFSTSDGVVKRCEQERTFRRCLRNYHEVDVIRNCVNIESYLRLTFTRNVTKWARQYVATFFETDYACTAGYKIFVYFNDCINRIPPLCKSDNTSACQEDYVKRIKETTEKECGTPAGCFAYKDSTINVCYDDGEAKCAYCQNLEYNNNFYNKLCNADESFNPPTTTTVPTTTTTPDNSTINIVVVTLHP